MSLKNRSTFDPMRIVEEIWTHLELPASALSSLSLPGPGGTTMMRQMPAVVPSSFKIGHLAQSTIALSALSAAVVHAFATATATATATAGPGGGSGTRRNGSGSGAAASRSTNKHAHLAAVPRTVVALRHALLEFQCERLYTLAGEPPEESWGPIGGLHPTGSASDGGGYVRIHDNFPHHRAGVLSLLGLDEGCVDRAAVSEKTRRWASSAELETVAVEERGLAVYALRGYQEWDALPPAKALGDLPVSVRRVRVDVEGGNGVNASSSSPLSSFTTRRMQQPNPRCLSGLRVLELSRVIAAPVAGKTLAAHGADVLWITSPSLPALPDLDCEFARGKRTAQLDINDPVEKEKLLELAQEADVVIQGYRPGSLEEKGFGLAEVVARGNPGVVWANLSAFGPDGEWRNRRGFDSLVQTCSGLAVSEAEHYYDGNAGGGDKMPARPLPCQALDHAAGYLLATGICAALYHREQDRAAVTDGKQGAGESASAYVVDVSLAGVGKYLRSLGQYPGRAGFEGQDVTVLNGTIEGKEQEERYFEVRDTDFGEMRFLRHSASVEGVEPRWERMPKPLGSDEAAWLDS
ncbi:CoA-transferase family III [Xylariaceae sp. FL0594]|nr:CoA-transferase family III [Xylariaceae sp. FL0594]